MCGKRGVALVPAICPLRARRSRKSDRTSSPDEDDAANRPSNDRLPASPDLVRQIALTTIRRTPRLSDGKTVGGPMRTRLDAAPARGRGSDQRSTLRTFAFALALLVQSLFVGDAGAQGAAKRIALVIGHNAYLGGTSATVGLRPLDNAVPDSVRMAQLLAKHGFEV